ncbi:hypothetical protein HDU76_000181 [Blyttiomyces sp. JEL0837]|nr:hypothetical protein HDU76_000181 [Blyttiomyces sp. JEL0837]
MAVLFLLALSAIVAVARGDIGTPCSMVQRVNAYRAAMGLSQLQVDQRFITSSIYHCDEMATKCGLMHESCQPYRIWWQRVQDYYPNWTILTENVAAQIDDQDGVMALFQRSPEHDENLRNPLVVSMGSAYSNVRGVGYWTQDFGTESPVDSSQIMYCPDVPYNQKVWMGTLQTAEGLCLDASAGQGFTVTAQNCNPNNRGQFWTIQPTDTNYQNFRVYAPFMDLCLDVFGYNQNNGGDVGMWRCIDGALNQQFNVNDNGGSVQIQSAWSQLCLELPYNMLHPAGWRVDQWACDGGVNQQWSKARFN